MKEQINLAKQRWKFALEDKKFRYSLVSFMLIVVIQFAFISQYQFFLETRQGVVFIDPITGNLPVWNLDIPTFIAIYSAHLLAIILALLKPEKFLQIIIGYFFVYFFRIIAQFLLPLEPPVGIIPMNDPLLVWFGDGQLITKDLFYSGHTSSTFMILLVTENFKARVYIFIALLVIVFGILIQRVHYTVDVYAAFFFTFTAYRLGLFIIKKLNFKFANCE